MCKGTRNNKAAAAVVKCMKKDLSTAKVKVSASSFTWQSQRHVLSNNTAPIERVKSAHR